MYRMTEKYKCEICNYSTNNNSSYKRHCRTKKHIKNCNELEKKNKNIEPEVKKIEVDENERMDKRSKILKKSVDDLNRLNEMMDEGRFMDFENVQEMAMYYRNVLSSVVGVIHTAVHVDDYV